MGFDTDVQPIKKNLSWISFQYFIPRVYSELAKYKVSTENVGMHILLRKKAL